MNDIDFASYSDDNTLYNECDSVDGVTYTLRLSAERLFKCFKDNQIKDNTDKFHLIFSTRDSNQIQIGNSVIKGSLCEKLLIVKFDHKLAFDQNVKSSGNVKR